MSTQPRILYTAEVTVTGGRGGHARASDEHGVLERRARRRDAYERRQRFSRATDERVDLADREIEIDRASRPDR